MNAGFVLQIDDPDLADAWQIHPQLSVAEYRKFAALRIEALNHALRDVAPERVRSHVYARLVGRKRVIAGTDCGLGPRVGHPRIAWAKLEALVEGARLATRALWERR